jgi:hypothetical protein
MEHAARRLTLRPMAKRTVGKWARAGSKRALFQYAAARSAISRLKTLRFRAYLAGNPQGWLAHIGLVRVGGSQPQYWAG